MTIKTVSELDWQNKQVLLRVDFNVPIKDHKILDNTRIREALPTIQYLLQHGAKVICMSHFGRPKGIDPALSLQTIAKELEHLVQQEVFFCQNFLQASKQDLARYPLVLLENLRFYAAEEEPQQDPHFAKKLAMLGDGYVNDAFSASHRKHSSITEVPKYFPEAKAAGFSLKKEIDAFNFLLKTPSHPLCTIIGGAKISTKFGALKALAEKSDTLIIGGAMAFTLLKAKAVQIGASLVEDSFLAQAQELLTNYQEKILLPVDFVAACELSQEASPKNFSIEAGIPQDMQGLDTGPKTLEAWRKNIMTSKTIFWNGPVGAYETPPFDTGTQALAEMIAASSAQKIAGGGDTLAAIHAAGLEKSFTHLSTGGGAGLELVEFGRLPGIDALGVVKEIVS